MEKNTSSDVRLLGWIRLLANATERLCTHAYLRLRGAGGGPGVDGSCCTDTLTQNSESPTGRPSKHVHRSLPVSARTASIGPSSVPASGMNVTFIEFWEDLLQMSLPPPSPPGLILKETSWWPSSSASPSHSPSRKVKPHSSPSRGASATIVKAPQDCARRAEAEASVAEAPLRPYFQRPQNLPSTEFGLPSPAAVAGSHLPAPT
mmetsp:Transcript_108440/g.306645  ORF Transcript_108440/g.306645 Transcript_108440/m.306645 type:complete len:205 (+) Transcript_108440:72-686(+)